MRSLIWNGMNERLRGRQWETRMKVLAPAFGGNNFSAWHVFGVSLSAPTGVGAWFSEPIMLLFTKLFCRRVPFGDPFAGSIANSLSCPKHKSDMA